MPAQSRIQLYGLWLGQSDITSHENNKSQTDWGRLFNSNDIVLLLSVFISTASPYVYNLEWKLQMPLKFTAMQNINHT